MDYASTKYKNIEVSYLPDLDGGGMGFGQEFVQVVKEKLGRVGHLFEFCAGPGFIGFSLLANGLCDRLTLADINPEACKVCEETVKKNGLQDKVSVYLSDCLDSIPQDEKWDLVVSNPPHWVTPDDAKREEGMADTKDIKKFDLGLEIHKRFYRNIHKHLKPGGSILLQENGRATKPEDFTELLRENNLAVKDIFKAKPLSALQCILQGKKIKHAKGSPYYFIWTQQR
ncbi:MAG: class I SAM-dependent methyltransferase [Candidatus Omnitrophota bacterium]